MSITKKDLQSALSQLDEKIAIRLNKHFYTKDAIDRKFDKVDQQFQKVDQQFQKVDQQFQKVDQQFQKVDQQFQKVAQQFKEQMHQTKLLFEDLKSNDLRIFHDKNDAQDEKIANHERRIGKLEETC